MSEPFWTPLGGQPVDYEGAWAAGTQYAPGDVVVHNGVNYLAVNPSLGVDPGVAAGPSDSGKELDVQQVTADIVVTTGLETSPQTVMTFAPLVFDGATAIILDFCWMEASSGSGTYLAINLWDEAVDLGRMWGAGVSDTGGVYAYRRFIPPAGTKTYRLRAWRLTDNYALHAGIGGAGARSPGIGRIVRA